MPTNHDEKLITIGKLAKSANVLPSTIHYYTKLGLLRFADETAGGYRLYDQKPALQRMKTIHDLQVRKRLTIAEIKAKLK
jgi:DNA-binding transcriptional MerR regulator